MSKQQEQPEQKGNTLNPSFNSRDFWLFMESNECRRKKSTDQTGPKKTISKPEIKKKIPAQIPCLRCKGRLVDNPAIYDGVDRGYCETCWANR
jgi:hypothetical protein